MALLIYAQYHGADTLLEIVNINQRIYIAYEIRHDLCKM